MKKEVAIKLLEGEKEYMLSHGGDSQAQALDIAIKALEQEPCEDCVSREDAIMCMTGKYVADTKYKAEDIISKHIRRLRALPPVTPTRKKGKWIFTKTIFDKYGCTAECPSCHKKWKTYDEIRWEKENKFCPNCGAEMESEE